MNLFWKVMFGTLAGAIVTGAATTVVCVNGKKIKKAFGKKDKEEPKKLG